MDIDRIGSQPLRPTTTDAVSEQLALRRAERAGRQPGASSTNNVPVDTVEISDRTRELLARAQQAVQDAPDVREAKVADIKKRVEDGTYSVSPELLARRLLGDNGGG